MRAIITYLDGRKEELKQLTEIHYGFYPNSIAFESEILGEGKSKILDDIREVEIFNK